MDSAPPWKRVIQMWEKCNRLSQLKVVFVPLILPFFVRQRIFLSARREGLHPLSYGSIFIESPSINCFWHSFTTPLPTDSPMELQTPAALCITSKDSFGTGARVSGRAHPALLPSARSLEDSRDQQTSRNSPLPTLLMLCRKASIASQRKSMAEVDFWPSSYVWRSMWSKESLQMIISQMRKKPQQMLSLKLVAASIVCPPKY